jgi:prolyl oligopeptidase PreP (S9A serine peptidase family)
VQAEKMQHSDKTTVFTRNNRMKIVLNLFILLLIGCNSSNQKKESAQLTDEDYNIQNVLVETRDGAKISVIVVRKNKTSESLPVILFT